MRYGWGLTVFPAPRVEETSLYFWITFVSLSKINWPYVLMALFLDLIFCSIDLCVFVFFFPPISHWLHCCSFTGSLEIRLCAKSSFFLLNHFLLLTSYLEIILDWENCKNSTENAPKAFTQAPLTLTSYITTVQRPVRRKSLWYTRFSIKILTSVSESS